MNNQKHKADIKYIPISAYVELDKLPTKDVVNNFIKGREKTKEIIRYLNWKKSSNELVSFCRAVFETKIPNKFDFLIDLNNESGGVETEATFTQALWNGIIPLDYIDLGYKTITIIEFKNGIPECLKSLKEMDNTDFKAQFMLCSKIDKNEIIKKLKNHH